jgi:hypothetical protein
LAAVEELKYFPNTQARSLGIRSQPHVGLIVSDITKSFLSRACERFLGSSGFLVGEQQARAFVAASPGPSSVGLLRNGFFGSFRSKSAVITHYKPGIPGKRGGTPFFNFCFFSPHFCNDLNGVAKPSQQALCNHPRLFAPRQ